MADLLPTSVTEEGSGDVTVLANEQGSFVDAAAAIDPETAASETDGATETADDAADPKKLADVIRGYKGTTTQQAKEIRDLKAQMASLKTVADEAAAARAELERFRQEQASVISRNQAQVDIQSRVEQAVADYAREMELRGVFAVVDDETRTVMLDKYRRAELRAEYERYEKESRDSRLRETDAQRRQREAREQAMTARDSVVARQAAILTDQLKAVGITDRTVTKDELIASLKKDVTAQDALEELMDLSKDTFDRIVKDARTAARKADIAQRDANGVDVFERGGSPSLSASEIWRRYGDGDTSITYQMAAEAERALKRANSR